MVESTITMPAEPERVENNKPKPRHTLADIFNRYIDDYCSRHKLSALQHKVIRAIRACRTAALGGHSYVCNLCGYIEDHFNSCRNRHCPLCQGASRMKWVQARVQELLPIPYYHVVITLPHILNQLALYNKELIYTIFYQSCSYALQKFGRDAQYLGGQLGFIAVLHTWSQTLSYHVHYHFIVAGGGLSRDGQRWLQLPYRSDFLFPAKAVSRVVCGKFLELLDEAYHAGRLQFPDSLSCLQAPVAFEHFKTDVGAQAWYCYSKKPFGSPREVVEYIGRYTHRIGLSNYRLVKIDNGKITFTYHPDRERRITKEMTLPAEEFIRRYLLHVVPSGFRRIRYGGYWANAVRKTKIETARRLLAVLREQLGMSATASAGYLGVYKCNSDAERRCPACGKGIMRIWEGITRDGNVSKIDSS